MKNYKITVSIECARAASNILRYYGDLWDCLHLAPHGFLEKCWESDLENSCWAAWGLSEDEICDRFRSAVRDAFDEAGISPYSEYSLSEISAL